MPGKPITGGMSAFKKIDPAENGGMKLTLMKYRKYIEMNMKKKFKMFVPEMYKQQVVAGMNYEIIYKVGEDMNKTDKINVKIYQPLGNAPPRVTSTKMFYAAKKPHVDPMDKPKPTKVIMVKRPLAGGISTWKTINPAENGGIKLKFKEWQDDI